MNLRASELCLTVVVVGLLLAHGEVSADQMGTAFTYQGRLEDGGGPVTNTSPGCDFEFELYNAAVSGIQIDGTQVKDGVGVEDGLFTVSLDFGSRAFNGDARWLKISVCCPSPSCTLEELDPLVELTPAPHALALPGLWTQQNATSPNLIGGYAGNWLTAGVYGATIGGGGDSPYPNRVTDNHGNVGGGINNQAGDNAGGVNDAPFATVAGGATNTASAHAATVGGGSVNEASDSYATVSGGWVNQASGSYSAVPGGRQNTAGGAYSFAAGRRAKAANNGAFVWGDSTDADCTSTANDQFRICAAGGVEVEGTVHATGTITSGSSITIDGINDQILSPSTMEFHVGGARVLRMEPDAISPNLIGGYSGNTVTIGVSGATIGGGGNSSFPNRVTDDSGTVGGGSDNQAGDNAGDTNDAYYATVGGGFSNKASAQEATVGGGSYNEASGHVATVPGGRDNTAGGLYSFAAGVRAKANHNGSFVWGDFTGADVTSERNNQFRVRANGGARFDDGAKWVNIYDDGTDLITTSTGAHLTLGGVWTDSSDRDRKEDLASVDVREVLTRVRTLPIRTWNFKVEDASVRHMGAMAQDFYAAFGLGNDDRHIAALDTGGVALAAIQGLHEIVEEKEREIESLQARVAALEEAVGSHRAQAGALFFNPGGLGIAALALIMLVGCVMHAHSRKGGVR